MYCVVYKYNNKCIGLYVWLKSKLLRVLQKCNNIRKHVFKHAIEVVYILVVRLVFVDPIEKYLVVRTY